MRRQRQLQAAAEAGAGNRDDDGFGAGLDLVDDLSQGRLGQARRSAELPNVGPGGEKATCAGEDDRPYRGVGLGPLEGRGDARADGVRQAVDRRIGEREDRDGAVYAADQRRLELFQAMPRCGSRRAP